MNSSCVLLAELHVNLLLDQLSGISQSTNSINRLLEHWQNPLLVHHYYLLFMSELKAFQSYTGEQKKSTLVAKVAMAHA